MHQPAAAKQPSHDLQRLPDLTRPGRPTRHAALGVAAFGSPDTDVHGHGLVTVAQTGERAPVERITEPFSETIAGDVVHMNVYP